VTTAATPEERYAACARELARHAVVGGIVAALDRDGIQVLILKGTALAYGVYAEPWERSRLDTDLLIAPRHEQQAADILRACGCRELPSVPGITGQRQFMTGGIGEVIDLHTRLAAPAAFSALDEFDALWSRSRPLPAFAPARWLGGADALLHACVHRVAHHNDSPARQWLHDIHLLASGLDAAGWQLFGDLAVRTATRAVCASGLTQAAAMFGTEVPPAVHQTLTASGDEPTARFLGGGLSEFEIQRLSFLHLSTWRERLALVTAHLFPPTGYMLARYKRAPAWLPLLYAHRVIRGSVTWWRNTVSR
jgi:hypothetical protein